MKTGDCLRFKGVNVMCYAYVARVNDDDTVDYVRDSLTRWNVSKKLIEDHKVISLDRFIEKVQDCADISPMPTPTKKQVKKVLKEFVNDFDACDTQKILTILDSK